MVKWCGVFHGTLIRVFCVSVCVWKVGVFKVGVKCGGNDLSGRGRINKEKV